MCHEGQSLSGARKRIDIRPVGSSFGVFTGPAMMSAAFAQALWPSFQRPPFRIRGPFWASLDRNVAKLWHRHCAPLRWSDEEKSTGTRFR
jgi:hypothetical protein